MWLMTTKGRPKAAERTLSACWDTGMRQPGIVYVDKDPTGYDDIKLPPNWSMVFGDGNLAGSKRYVLEHYPDERCYGWVADDNYPETMYWSYTVEDIAVPWRLVHCRDRWVSEMNHANYRALVRTRNLGGGICWGGDLIRSVGWWAPPGITQASIDWCWTSLVGDSPLSVYLAGVYVRHDNWNTGKRAKDKTDEWGPHMQPDIARIGAYIKTAEFRILRERLIREYNEYITGGA